MAELDSIYQTALHHLCDHCGWSLRIGEVALQLAHDCQPHVINTWSIGHAKFFTTLLFVCDGAGKYAQQRCRIAQELIHRDADIDACDQHGNTPYLLAAAVGFVDMVELLVAAHANIYAKNDAGASARGRCLLS